MSKQYFYPNLYGRIMLESVEQQIGKDGLAKLLESAGLSRYTTKFPPDDMKKAFPFDDVGALCRAIYTTYGRDRAREIALHAGRLSFRSGIAEFKDLVSAISPVLYAGSEAKRYKMGLQIYSRLFNMISDQVVEVDEDDAAWYWRVTRCPLCWGWHGASEPVCFLINGVMDASFEWISDGKHFEMEETSCIARGDAHCTVRISKATLSGGAGFGG